jgi:phosphatidate cytidylyltransferase
MALNFSTFRVRALSAVVFVAIMLGGMFWNDWSFFFLFAFIAVGCLYEYQKLLARIYTNYKNISAIHKWGVLILAVIIMFSLSLNLKLHIKFEYLKYMGQRIAPAIIILILLADFFTKKFNFENIMISFFGLVYIPMSLSLFFQLKLIPSLAMQFKLGLNKTPAFFGDWSFTIPVLIIVSIWINDTMAYLVGSVIGSKPLSKISPNKTWEGTIAGIILSVLLVNNVLSYFIPLDEKLIFLITIVSVISGTFGDLFESSLKRQAGVKDSGSMMPGHGGFLDRFDSILLATPFVWLLLRIVFSPGN